MPRPLYCMYHGNKIDHRIKDCSIYINTTRKMNQDTTQPLPQLHSREVNHTMQWAPRNQQHSSLYPSHYLAQTYQNFKTQPSTYYQSYHYATPNHPELSPAPQMIYHPALPQKTYPASSNTNANQLKGEPLPPPQQAQEPLQQTKHFPTHGTILTITGGSNTDFETKRQRRDYYHQVNYVTVEGPVTQTKWSYMSLTFSSQDINLSSFPHTDVMVITIHIDR
jgi:hypothetical protein